MKTRSAKSKVVLKKLIPFAIQATAVYGVYELWLAIMGRIVPPQSPMDVISIFLTTAICGILAMEVVSFVGSQFRGPSILPLIDWEK